MAKDAASLFEDVIKKVNDIEKKQKKDSNYEIPEEVLEFVKRRFLGENAELISYGKVNNIETVVKTEKEYTFLGGEEEDFAKFISDYIKSYACVPKESMVYRQIVKFIWWESKDNFDYAKLWSYIDKTTAYGTDCMLDQIRFDIFREIDFITFKTEAFKLENYEIMYDHFHRYAYINELSMIDIIRIYLAAIENKAKDDKKTPEYIRLCVSKILFAWVVIASQRNNFYLNDKRIIVDVIRLLLPKANLDLDIEIDDSKTHLKDYLACILASRKLSSIKEIDELIRSFLDLNPGTIFKLGISAKSSEITGIPNSTSVIELSAMIGDGKRIIDLVNNENILLCSDLRYNQLKYSYAWPEEDFGDVDDLITSNVPNERFAHGNLLDLLLNGRVKMIYIGVIFNAWRGGFLDQLEMIELLDHIKENDILVYDYVDSNAISIADVSEYLEKLLSEEK